MLTVYSQISEPVQGQNQRRKHEEGEQIQNTMQRIVMRVSSVKKKNKNPKLIKQASRNIPEIGER